MLAHSRIESTPAKGAGSSRLKKQVKIASDSASSFWME